jgi:hypothetical protein
MKLSSQDEAFVFAYAATLWSELGDIGGVVGNLLAFVIDRVISTALRVEDAIIFAADNENMHGQMRNKTGKCMFVM